MKKKTTIRDIAEAAGVSISSVHLALNGKSGVSEATRERVKRIAEEYNYKPSLLASNLKRDPRSVAVILPPRRTDSRHYFHPMWNALDDYIPLADDYNLHLTPFVCREGGSGLDGFSPEQFNGVVAVGLTAAFHKEAFSAIVQSGVPLVLVDSDVPGSGRICCVDADVNAVGRVTAELLVDMIHRVDGEILVCGVGPSFENRRLTEEAICRGLEPYGMSRRLRIMNFDREDETCFQELRKALSGGVFAGACAVNSRATLALGNAVAAAGQQGYFPVIGNGFFAESRDFLQSGLMTAAVDKRPYAQCRRALSIMENLLVRDEPPAGDVHHIKIDVIFRSLLEQYNLRT